MLTSFDRLLFVRGVPIFKELRDDFLIRLASIMDELAFPSKHTIFTQGQEGRSMYIVVSGRVRVYVNTANGEREIAQLDKGATFGEMSLFDAEPRSASVSTLTSCECLILTQQQLYEAIDETPGIAVNIIRLFSIRIRELNERLNKAVEENKQLTELCNNQANALTAYSQNQSFTQGYGYPGYAQPGYGQAQPGYGVPSAPAVAPPVLPNPVGLPNYDPYGNSDRARNSLG